MGDYVINITFTTPSFYGAGDGRITDFKYKINSVISPPWISIPGTETPNTSITVPISVSAMRTYNVKVKYIYNTGEFIFIDQDIEVSGPRTTTIRSNELNVPGETKVGYYFDTGVKTLTNASSKFECFLKSQQEKSGGWEYNDNNGECALVKNNILGDTRGRTGVTIGCAAASDVISKGCVTENEYNDMLTYIRDQRYKSLEQFNICKNIYSEKINNIGSWYGNEFDFHLESINRKSENVEQYRRRRKIFTDEISNIDYYIRELGKYKTELNNKKKCFNPTTNSDIWHCSDAVPEYIIPKNQSGRDFCASKTTPQTCVGTTTGGRWNPYPGCYATYSLMAKCTDGNVYKNCSTKPTLYDKYNCSDSTYIEYARGSTTGIQACDTTCIAGNSGDKYYPCDTPGNINSVTGTVMFKCEPKPPLLPEGIYRIENITESLKNEVGKVIDTSERYIHTYGWKFELVSGTNDTYIIIKTLFGINKTLVTTGDTGLNLEHGGQTQWKLSKITTTPTPMFGGSRYTFRSGGKWLRFGSDGVTLERNSVDATKFMVVSLSHHVSRIDPDFFNI